MASASISHFRNNPEHNNRPGLVALERRNLENDSLVGAAVFRNSFSQQSSYVYLGQRWDFEERRAYAKITGGLLHGYRGEYKHKIPFNRFGIAPAIIPSVGVQVDRYRGELVLLGNSALMLNVGLQF